MGIWIRSQNRNRLIKVKEIYFEKDYNEIWFVMSVGQDENISTTLRAI